MCSKNRINHHTKHHTWTLGFLGGNPSREKTTAAVSQPSIFYCRENILQHMCWCRLYQHAGTHLRLFTSLSWKGAPTPWLVYQPLLEGSYDPLTRLPAFPGRELRPPDLVYQPLLEGSYNPLTEGYNPLHHLGPLFINFHTGSNHFNRTQLAGQNSSYFQTEPFSYF